MSSPYDAVLVVVDRFSKRLFAFPTNSHSTSADIASLLERKLVCEYGRGWPLDLRMDNDIKFATAVFKTLLARQGTRVSFTSNNHSSAGDYGTAKDDHRQPGAIGPAAASSAAPPSHIEGSYYLTFQFFHATAVTAKIGGNSPL
eukprot:COSAG01_NODE_7884_length_3008_cov_1.501891_1_plen_144_part_00